MNAEPPQDEFTESAAAYVLGALPVGERQAFEAHLRSCATCTRAVTEFAGMPALLRRAGEPSVAPEHGAIPETVLSGLAGKVARRRRRDRILRGSAASIAAACLLVLLLVVVLPPANEVEGRPANAGVVLTQLADTPMHATVRLANVAWGTKIGVDCSYDSDSDLDFSKPIIYVLEVTGKDGQKQQIATWRAVPGKVSTVDAATSFRKGEITDMEILTASGKPVLRLPR